jgi:hypothetical protein
VAAWSAVPRSRLTLAQARRVALAAQGFGRPRPAAPPGSRAVREVVRRLGAVQIDSVNVLVRAHYLPVLSRLGPYDRALLDDASSRAPRALFEYWGHEAALLGVGMHPLLRWRMQRADDEAWRGMLAVRREQPGLVRLVAQEVLAHGPVTATDLERRLEADAGPRERWGWNWSQVKRALEYLFWAGEITSAGRDASFRRRYASPEAVLPRAVLAAPTPDPEDARRQLVLRAAGALGVATLADLADYFRMAAVETDRAVGHLVARGQLVAVEVPGWPPAFAPADLVVPRGVPATAMLAPFDPLVWFRPRTERLFGMRYRIEIYTPAQRRVHGYYVLPFLHEERLVARVDLKADRGAGRLRVRAAHPEPGLGRGALPALAGQLAEMAAWLGLTDVQVEPVGELASPLAAEVRRWDPGRGGES